MDASGGLTSRSTGAQRPERVVGLTAVEIAALVRSGEVCAEEVTRAHLDRIAAVGPRVDAFRVVRTEEALAEAHAVDTALTRFALPLAGVPVAVTDTVAVKRLRKAGAVVVGITGEDSKRPDGGSAAAVAAGCVPLALGTDGSGSRPLPAVGLVTLNGMLATAVTDLAVAHAVLAGSAPAPPEAPGRPLRIAVSTGSPVPGVRADAATRAAVDATAEALLSEGHVVVRSHPRIPARAALRAVARWTAGGRVGPVRPRLAEVVRERLTRFFTGMDVLLTPVPGGPPLRGAPWTAAWNLAGLPALVLPAGGGPVAVQFLGPPDAEQRLLWLAGELERRAPWRRHAPPLDPSTVLPVAARV